MLLELGMRPVARTGEQLEHPAFLGEEASEVPQVPGGFLSPDVGSRNTGGENGDVPPGE
ncbi:MAG: hypothetical protein ACRD0K_03795 [Egibacteraceae bacterium]